MKNQASSISLERARITIPDQVLSQDLQGETVILDLKDGQYYGLNAVGSRIWAMLQDGRSPEAIIAALTDEYRISSERARGDLSGFLSVLQTRGLVSVSLDGSPNV